MDLLPYLVDGVGVAVGREHVADRLGGNPQFFADPYEGAVLERVSLPLNTSACIARRYSQATPCSAPRCTRRSMSNVLLRSMSLAQVAFVHGMIELQHADPALNDAILRRSPDAVALLGICDRSIELGRRLVAEAHADGSLAPDFTEDDLFHLLWLAGVASREPNAPTGCERALDTAWTR
jgi:hypothetical protein